MSGKKKQENEDKPEGMSEKEFGQYNLVKAQNDMVVRTHPRILSWDDVAKYTSELQEFPIIYQNGHMYVKYKELMGGVYNQVVEDITRKLGANAIPSEFERKKQDELMRKMVVFIGDRRMQLESGDPMEAHWLEVPAPLYEQMREGFFGTTGEIRNEIEQGTGLSVDQLIEMLKKMKDGKNGILTDQNVSLKN